MGEGPEKSWVEVEGGRLYVERHGEGPPLVLLHGWTLDGRMFAPQLEAWAAEFEVIVPDRRGFGRSKAPPSLARELGDLDRLFEAFGLRSVHLLGMSQGGRVALRYAATRPARLRSLILQGAVVDGFAPEEKQGERLPIAEWAAMARQGGVDAVKAQWLAHPMLALGTGAEDGRRLLQTIVADYAGQDLVGFEAADYAFGFDVLAALSNFTAPTLVLTGANESAARKAHARVIYEAIPNAREQTLERCGHLANLAQPEAYAEAVAAFVREVEAARKAAAGAEEAPGPG